ncbi:MAG TPA: trypsin-like peptidase domain-containing protein [Acidimicrobiales bacterium]|nr:trypsin-like peptidase domain-containing protein [Acidimicrobiales bacterium]
MPDEDDTRNDWTRSLPASGGGAGSGEEASPAPGWHVHSPAGADPGPSGEAAGEQPAPGAEQPAPGGGGQPYGGWGPHPGAWPPPPGWHPGGDGPSPAGGQGHDGQPGVQGWGPAGPSANPWAGGQWGPGPYPGYGQGGHGAWGGQPYGYGYGYNPDPRTRRRRRRGAVAALLAAGALIVGGAGVGIGAGLDSTSQPSATAPSGSSGTGSSGGSFGSGSSGGSFGSGSSGSSGLGVPGASGSSGRSVSTSAGSPSDVTAIANKVDPGLVDINTQLAYQSEQAAGTGMVLTSSGEVLTNNHVIEGETALSVTDLGNGRTYRAKVVGYDRTDDIAVLQLQHASGLSTVKLGNSSPLRTGEPVVGIGNAGGAGGTPSVAGGSITALNQSITASDQGSGTTETLHGLIQSNADIRPGDSGGPLVTANGRVVGIDTAASSNGSFTFQTPSNAGTEGFSIPINEAMRIARQIEAGRSSSQVHIGATPFLGVEVTTPTQLYNAGASSGLGGFGGFGLGASGTSGTPTTPPTTSGAAIANVLPGTSAATAGLSSGDIITSINGQPVTSPAGLTKQILQLHTGQSVSLGYVTSSGAQHSTTIALKAGPPQ